MSLKNQSRDLLKSKDASITNPRLIVLGILLKQDVPLTIDKLLKLSRGKLAQSTLYRVINDLQRFGLVTEFTNPENTMVVELKVEETSHHHHLFCKNCGRIIDIELGGELEKQIENEVMDIQEQYELSIDGHSLELIGLCDLCN
tara:strand:+ start:1251 stop:1682 length:432 start_codon:yes stop_codon:yes gene_type:complete